MAKQNFVFRLNEEYSLDELNHTLAACGVEEHV
jgi:hypothetical protein